NNISIYCSEGVKVSSTSNMFIANSILNVDIIGFGDFETDGGSILFVPSLSTIDRNEDKFEMKNDNISSKHIIENMDVIESRSILSDLRRWSELYPKNLTALVPNDSLINIRFYCTSIN